MEKLRCLVVDDEPLAARLIAGYVERTDFLSLAGVASDAEEALALVNEGGIDLLFLDIRMPRLTGLDLARLLPEGVGVVFTTAYADHAVEGFRVDAVDYLLKPVSYGEFLQAATRALRSAHRAQQASAAATDGYLLVKSEYRLLRLPIADVLYVEGLKDYVKIYLDGDAKPVLTLMSIKAMEDALPRQHFLRVHRSFIVNVDKVRLIERNSIIMCGRCIPVSDTYRHAFNAAIGIGGE